MRIFGLRVLVMGFISIGFMGCIERRLTIRSDPPGALVIMSGGKMDSPSDEHELGATPVSTHYIYHGTRRITLVDPEGQYETLVTQETIQPRWYEWFPVEFVLENLWPWNIRDHRLLEYTLTRRTETATKPLLDRAESLRGEATVEFAIP